MFNFNKTVKSLLPDMDDSEIINILYEDTCYPITTRLRTIFQLLERRCALKAGKYLDKKNMQWIR